MIDLLGVASSFRTIVTLSGPVRENSWAAGTRPATRYDRSPGTCRVRQFGGLDPRSLGRFSFSIISKSEFGGLGVSRRELERSPRELKAGPAGFALVDLHRILSPCRAGATTSGEW